MVAIITRGGKGAAINEPENDDNLESLCGINEAKVGAYEVVAANQNSTIECSNASTTIITLDLILDILSAIDSPDFEVTIKNIGAGDVTVTPTTDTFDDGSATKILAQYEWITIQTDSTQALWNIINSSDANKIGGVGIADLFQLSTDNVTTGNMTISNSAPQSIMVETDATSDNQRWDVLASLEAIAYRTVNTAITIARNYLGVTRTGVQIDKITLGNSTDNPDIDLIGQLQINSADVTSTATELNYNDITTLGIVEASKTVTADSSGDISQSNAPTSDDHLANKTYVDDQISTNLVTGALFKADHNAFVGTAAGSVGNFTDEVYDPSSDYDTGTKRYTPSTAGYYVVTVSINHTAFTAFPETATMQIRKNGTAVNYDSKSTSSAIDVFTGFLTVSTIILMNGTTDYIDTYNSSVNIGFGNVGNFEANFISA